MTIYTCPKCGADLMFYRIDTYPPIDVACCNRCGWEHKKMQKIERVPYIVDVTSLDTATRPDEVKNAET